MLRTALFLLFIYLFLIADVCLIMVSVAYYLQDVSDIRYFMLPALIFAHIVGLLHYEGKGK